MKKTLSILLIVTMLLSMCVVALPTFAATETVDNSKTPGHADYDHVTVEEFATALGIETSAVNVITNYDEFCAITDGTAEAIKYYLVILSDGDTLDLTGKNHIKVRKNVYIDFNGYTVNLAGDNTGVFEGLSNVTIKNLKMTGDRRYVSDRGYYPNRRKETAQSILTTASYSFGATNGVVHLDNIISDCDTIVHQQHGYGKDVGGLIHHAAGGSTFKNCVNNGDIIFVSDTAAINATAGSSNTVLAVRAENAAGIVAVVSGDATFEGCVNTGDIEFQTPNTPTSDDANMNYGGVVALVSGNATFVDCSNSGKIDTEKLNIDKDGAGANSSIGGVVGKVTKIAKIEGCSNSGDIIGGAIQDNAGSNAKHYGGIIGRVETYAYIGYDVTDVTKVGKPCYNEGDITVNWYSNQSHASTVGGILGSGWCGALIYGATNKGDIIVTFDYANSTKPGAGGIVGALGSTSTPDNLSYLTNCVNEGDIISTATTAATWNFGGMIGRVADNTGTITITNCENKGTMTCGKNNGGFVGIHDNGNIVISNSVNNGTATNGETNAGFIGNQTGGSITISGSTNNGSIIVDNNARYSNYAYAAGFIGYTVSTINISNSSNTGDVEVTVGRTHSGGVVGYAKGTKTLLNVTNYGDVTATLALSEMQAIGGIIGYAAAAKTDFDNVINFGNVTNLGNGTADYCIGGVIGRVASNNPFTMDNVTNFGHVTSSVANAGGIVGVWQTWGTFAPKFTNCANAGNISAKNAAGILAKAYADQNAGSACAVNATLTNCINVGAITGTSYAGGIAGYDQPGRSGDNHTNKYDMFGCYNAGALTATTTDAFAIKNTAGRTTLNVDDKCKGDATLDEALVYASSLGINLVESMPKALDLAIKGAELLYNSDVVYTADSWANFLTALNTVKAYQAATDLRKADPNEVNGYIKLLANAKAALVKGADIYTGADFAKLDGQDGVFNLMADITITEGVDSFAGTLNANGHTITVDGCALFGELDGATIDNLVIEGTATKALFGKAVGEVLVKYVYVDVEGDFEKAVLFDAADSAAEIEVKAAYVAATSAATAAILAGNCDVELDTVIADVKAPKLTTASDAECDYAYLVGVEAFIDEDAVELADGAVAYAFTKAFVDTNALAAVKVDFASVTLVQIIGVDAFPAVAPFAVDGINVVAPVDASDLSKGYKNAAFRYEDATPVIPVEPIAPVAPIATGLQSSIARAEALVQANYTADTWTALQTALTAAKAALTADTQAAIDSARLALDLAIAGLKKAPAAAVTPVNVEALNAAIAAAEALKASDYTTATWSAVQAALSAAKSAKALGDQAKVDAATAALNAAVAALAKAPAPEAPSISKPETTPATEEGCGSVIGGAAVVLTAVIALGAGVSFKKKED